MTITLELLAIILSIVSVTITVIGFFASLKFYRDGVELQQSANDALTALTEKTEAIRGPATGMFDKTLDAAIGREAAVDASFEDLEDQLDATKESLIADFEERIGDIGKREREQIRQTVNERLEDVKQKVESARASATEMTEDPRTHYYTGLQAVIVASLLKQGGEASFSEIQEDLAETHDVRSIGSLRMSLNSLINMGMVELETGDAPENTVFRLTRS